MNLEKNKTYFISFSNKCCCLNYTGKATFTGEVRLDGTGDTLYLFTNLKKEVGFTENGWFGKENIFELNERTKNY